MENTKYRLNLSALMLQVAKVTNSVERAVSVLCVKDLLTARVDSIKGAFGFLDVEDREKKVYFR